MHYCYTNHLCIFFDTGIINTLFNSRVDMTDSPTRENGTPPPEEDDPATKELDNHGPTQQGGGENHKSSTHDESGEEEDEEDPVEGDAMGLRRLFRQADQHKWSMDTILADHFMEHTRLHLSDADMKVNLEEFPPPDNINAVLHMGTSVKNLLKKEGKNAVVDQDQDWSAVQSRLQDVMGPLGAAWSQCVRLRQKKAEDHEVDIRALGDSLQLSALTLAQAIQKISWYRRVHALSALGNIKNVKDTLKEEKVQQIFEKDTSDNLFPTQFDEHLKAMKGSRQNLVNHFKPEEKKKKKEPPKTNQPKDRRYTNQPFRGAPSRGGYSDGRPSNNNSYFGRNPFYDSSKKKGQGKHASTPFPSQHAFTTRMVADSPTRPSKPRRIVSCKGGDSTTGRKNSEVLGQLEIVDQRPGDSRHSKGVGGTFDRHSNPGQNPSRHTDEQSGESGNGQGGRKYAGQGSHPSGHSQGGPILEQCFRNPKRGGTISPNHKSQEIKRIRTLPPFQNGGIKGRETPTEPRGLDVQNRSERRIFFSPPGNQVTKTSEVQMEGNPVRIPLPSLRSGPSTQNIYQDDEGPGGPPKEIGHSPGHLPGRSTDHGVVSGRGDPGKGHGNVPVSSFGTDHKLEEINSPPIPGTGVLGGHGQQPDHGLFPVKGKETEIDFKVSGNTSEPDNNAEIPVFSHWEVVVDSGSSHTSPAATQISTTIVHKSASSKTALRARNNAFFQRHFGIKMVDREPKPSGGKPASHFTPRSGHLFRCSQDRGVGSSLPSGCHRGDMVNGRETATHKCTGVNGSRAGHKDVYQRSDYEIYPHEDRQHNSTFIPHQDGGYKERTNDRDNQKDLGVSFATQDHTYCRMDPVTYERRSGLGVEECQGLLRMDAVPQHIQGTEQNNGSALDRSIRIEGISSTATVSQLESRSELFSSRCVSTGLDARIPLRLSTILPHHKSTEASGGSDSKENDSHHPIVANSTMVPAGHGHVNSNPLVITNNRSTAFRPLRRDSSITERLLSKSGGLASVRDRLRGAGISEEASSLIVNSRRGGTTQARSIDSVNPQWHVITQSQE